MSKVPEQLDYFFVIERGGMLGADVYARGEEGMETVRAIARTSLLFTAFDANLRSFEDSIPWRGVYSQTREALRGNFFEGPSEPDIVKYNVDQVELSGYALCS